MAQLRERIRYLHYSLRTEEASVHWVRFFIHFHGVKHPRDMGKPEIEAFLSMLATECRVSVSLLYRTGMRLQEGLSLRVKDIDFDRNAIVVREGKGAKDRVVMLPRTLAQPLHKQLSLSRALWEADRAAERPVVAMPDALECKYPRAGIDKHVSAHTLRHSPSVAMQPAPAGA